MKTMPLSWIASDVTIQGRVKRINEITVQYYNSGDFFIGNDATDVETVAITGMDTNLQRKTFPPGHGTPGQVYIFQESAEPLTLLALMVEFMVY